MKNKQIPNPLVYGVLFAVVLGITTWLLAFHNDSPTNWILYLTIAVAALAALVKFVLFSRKPSTIYTNR